VEPTLLVLLEAISPKYKGMAKVVKKEKSQKYSERSIVK